MNTTPSTCDNYSIEAGKSSNKSVPPGKSRKNQSRPIFILSGDNLIDYCL